MQPDDELCELDAATAVRRLVLRDFGVLEYPDALLRRIEAQRDLHALIHVDAGRVRAGARATDNTPSAQRGALHGLPLIVKEPMARTVEDCALLDAVVCDDRTPLAELSLRGLLLGVAQPFWRGLDGALAAQASMGRLPRWQRRGCNWSSARWTSTWPTAHRSTPMRPLPAAYAAALTGVRQRLRPAYERCFTAHRLDALALPTTPLPPGLVGEDETRLDGGPAVAHFRQLHPACRPGQRDRAAQHQPADSA